LNPRIELFGIRRSGLATRCRIWLQETWVHLPDENFKTGRRAIDANQRPGLPRQLAANPRRYHGQQSIEVVQSGLIGPTRQR
jgi:hypothetical protein